MISADGRAAGYIRVQPTGMPIDTPIVWLQNGNPVELPTNGPYAHGYAVGFLNDGRAAGAVRYQQVGLATPGYWDKEFHPLPHFGRGGGVYVGNDAALVGTTGDTDIDGTYLPKATAWIDGIPFRVSGLPGERRNDFIGKMNVGGLYVGSSYNKVTGLTQAFIAQRDQAQLLSYPGFNVIGARDINDSNWIIGAHSPVAGERRAYRARAFSTEIYDMGLLPGYSMVFPAAMNDSGAAVGFATNSGTGERAVYWPPGALQPLDLHALARVPNEPLLVEAMDINDAGQILTRGLHGYYVLTPRHALPTIYDPGLTELNLFDVAPYPLPPTARVPEPAFTGVVLALALGARWRRIDG